MISLKKTTNKNPKLNYIHVYGDNVSCKIFPNLGASIQELAFNDIDIIHGIAISENGLETYKEVYQSAILFPFVGRIPNGEYIFENKNYRLETNETNRSNALHGLVFNKAFKVDNCDTSTTKASVQLSYCSDGTLKGFPFKFELKVIYIISNEGLKIDFKIFNQNESSFPFGLGWHPYFKTDDLSSNTLSFSSKEKLVCDEQMIPLKKTNNTEPSTFMINNKLFDDTFILLKNEVYFKTNNYKIKMNFKNSHNSFLQIYTPLDRKSIAIEPITSAPNTFNNTIGLLELKPNNAYHWNIKLKILE